MSTRTTNDGEEQRRKTDQTLRQERARTDSELERKESSIQVRADSAVAHARVVADENLSAARATEDRRADRLATSSDARAVVNDERARVDRILDIERTVADRNLEEERAALSAAVVNLLAQERGETDHALLNERSIQREKVEAVQAQLDGFGLRLEAQSEAMDDAIRTRESFLSMASHELRTPLTAMQLQIQGLLHQARSSGEPFVMRLLQTERHVKRLEVLIRRLLDVSDLSAGRLSLDLETVDLGAVIRGVVKRMELTSSQAGSDLVVQIPPGITGEWDRRSLDQIVINLLANAIKYGEGRPISVRLEEEATVARVAVEDQGIGVAEEDQQRIFHRFERAVSDGSYGGFGLGLWVVKQLVIALGGQVTVSSRLGAGATFTVELPRSPLQASLSASR